MSETTYPRDLVGYGRTPPHPRWPTTPASACSSSSTTRKAARTTFCTAIRRRSLFVGDRRRAALAGAASHEHGVDLRIRRPRRLLAAVAAVHRTQPAGDRLRRRDRACMRNPERWPPGRRPVGRSRATASNGSTTGISPPTRSGRISRRRFRLHTEATGSVHLGWYTGRTSEHTLRLVWRRAASSTGRFLRDDCPTGRGPNGAILSCLHARRQRHALRDPQGFNSGDQFFAY
jgi:hypothetical protein